MKQSIQFYGCEFFDDSHIVKGVCRLYVPVYGGHRLATHRHQTVFMIPIHNTSAIKNVIEAHRRTIEAVDSLDRFYSLCLYESDIYAQAAKLLLEELHIGSESRSASIDANKPFFVETGQDIPSYIPQGGWDPDPMVDWGDVIEKYYKLMQTV